jgi:hypothetical protein
LELFDEFFARKDEARGLSKVRLATIWYGTLPPPSSPLDHVSEKANLSLVEQVQMMLFYLGFPPVSTYH